MSDIVELKSYFRSTVDTYRSEAEAIERLRTQYQKENKYGMWITVP